MHRISIVCFQSRTLSIGLVVTLLSACGGGSTTGSVPVASNAAPIFTSAISAIVKENSTGTIYTAEATDADGDNISYSLSGIDAAQFALNAKGALSFISEPDFEIPKDSGADNQYDITITASDGKASTSQAVTITVTNDKEGIAVKRIATGFVDPVCIDFLNQLPAPTAGPQGRIAVGQRDGKIFAIDGGTGTITQIAAVGTGELIECKSFERSRAHYYSGLYGAVRQSNGRVYLQRYEGGASLQETELLPAGTPATAISLTYAANETFYMATGDISGNEVRNAASPLGKVFRLTGIDPYAGASLRPGYFTLESLAPGVRDPAGGSMINDDLLLADRGGSREHELTLFNPSTSPLDLGWPYYEGRAALVTSPPTLVTAPALTYSYGTGNRQGLGIVGGWPYAGPATALAGHYIFGDKSGSIWSIMLSKLSVGGAIDMSQIEDRTADFQPDVGSIDSPVGFAVDDMNRFYILDSDGEVFRVDGT
ncbi:MAG: hypothetical protein ABGW87_08960 [Sphingomonadaceae bacterium]